MRMFRKKKLDKFKIIIFKCILKLHKKINFSSLFLDFFFQHLRLKHIQKTAIECVELQKKKVEIQHLSYNLCSSLHSRVQRTWMRYSEALPMHFKQKIKNILTFFPPVFFRTCTIFFIDASMFIIIIFLFLLDFYWKKFRYLLSVWNPLLSEYVRLLLIWEDFFKALFNVFPKLSKI